MGRGPGGPRPARHATRSRRPRVASLPLPILILALLLPLKLRAQASQARAIAGIVVDSTTGAPIPGAVVRLSAATAAVTDREGRFRLEVPVAPMYLLSFEQFGYRTGRRAVPLAALGDGVSVGLIPDPVELEGLEVVVRGQLEVRRVRSARDVSVVTAAELAELGGAGVELIRRIAPLTRSCHDASGALCLEGRRKTIVTLCVDDEPVFEGPAELDRLRPWEMHSVEVFDRGRHIRVYTRAFMREVMAGRRRLRPLDWCLGA